MSPTPNATAPFRFLFSSTRGAGHLQPLLPYARALMARGHQVLVAAPAAVDGVLADAGIAHAVFDHPGDDALAPIWARLHQVSPDQANAIALTEIFAGVNARVALPKLLETVGSWRPDVIVRDSVEFAALVAAARAGVPHARVAVHAVSFEEEIPRLTAAPLDRLRAQVGASADDGASVRAEAIFTSYPPSFDGPLAQGQQRLPFRTRMPTGQPTPGQAHWAPPDDRLPLLYVTFGTIVGTMERAREIFRTALDALAPLPVRALLTTGRGFDSTALGAVPENVQVEPWVPQDDVLPRAAAVVCHGGSGTVQGALAAGLPLVVVPQGADQPHNARRVAAVGAGIALAGRAAADPLRAAIRRVLDEREFRESARRVAEEIASLPPLERAVDALEAMAAAR